MRSVTVANLITRIRRWVVADGDTTFLPDAEVLDYLNEEWPRVYALYLKAYPELFRTELEVTTTGVATIALPADYFATIAVDYKRATDDFDALDRLMEAERNKFNKTSSSRAWAFRVLGNNLALFPTPPTGQVYRHVYLPTAVTLGLGDSIDGLLGHEKLLELEVAIRILISKDEVPAAELKEERERLKAEVNEEAQMRQAREPIRPVFVDDDYYDDFGSSLWRSRP